jgi:lysozyme
MGTTKEAQVLGIDVSHHQGSIDWKAVKKSGIGFAFIKATEGGTVVDSMYAGNWLAMKEAGIVRGAYHFFRAAQDPGRQARNFLKVVMLEPGDLPPVLDLEIDDHIPKGAVIDRALAWLEAVEGELKRRPLIYTGPAFMNGLRTEKFGGYPLWIANYGVQTPKIPFGWKEWSFWQYSETGSVKGIKGSVDCNRFNGDRKALVEFINHSILAAMIDGPVPVVNGQNGDVVPVPANGHHQTYTVKKGDTLGAIAAHHGVSLEELIAANKITNPNRIRIGQVLQIPEE